MKSISTFTFFFYFCLRTRFWSQTTRKASLSLLPPSLRLSTSGKCYVSHTRDWQASWILQTNQGGVALLERTGSCPKSKLAHTEAGAVDSNPIFSQHISLTNTWQTGLQAILTNDTQWFFHLPYITFKSRPCRVNPSSAIEPLHRFSSPRSCLRVWFSLKKTSVCVCVCVCVCACVLQGPGLGQGGECFRREGWGLKTGSTVTSGRI